MKNLRKREENGRPSKRRLASFGLIIFSVLALSGGFQGEAIAADVVEDAGIAWDGGLDAGTKPVVAPEVSADKPMPSAEPVAEPRTALDNFSSEILNILIPGFLAFIGFLVTWILNKVRVKLHLTVSDQQIDSWARLAERAAGRGAEWARNQVKDLTEDEKIPGPDILEVAVNWATEMGKTFKLPEMGREKLEIYRDLLSCLGEFVEAWEHSRCERCGEVRHLQMVEDEECFEEEVCQDCMSG